MTPARPASGSRSVAVPLVAAATLLSGLVWVLSCRGGPTAKPGPACCGARTPRAST
ncbi:hypothetical protein [Actinokineospora pegani]|uniref:hypothetical protein n=1 Tax=Actinokineospora pegani TaxID=2654637 RepID=UPI0012EAADCF|nr:hypothetical protein [Actinokineospora pegani]